MQSAMYPRQFGLKTLLLVTSFVAAICATSRVIPHWPALVVGALGVLVWVYGLTSFCPGNANTGAVVTTFIGIGLLAVAAIALVILAKVRELEEARTNRQSVTGRARIIAAERALAQPPKVTRIESD